MRAVRRSRLVVRGALTAAAGTLTFVAIMWWNYQRIGLFRRAPAFRVEFLRLGALGVLGSCLAGALIGALALGQLLRRRSLDPSVALGTLFSLMMGLAFLGIGLGRGPRSELLGLLWGSLLFVGPVQIAAMAVVGVALVLFVVALDLPLRLLLFSRELAAVLAPERLLFGLLLLLAAAAVTVNLETVGGLMLYSLITNPAVAALRVARSYRAAVALGALLGAVAATGGFFAAYWLDLPVGACIVLFSSLLVGVAWWLPR
jgi:manganese/iron transport system permease protein